ncbi:MAG: adenylyltransferase/cytidyltransferase family protein [Methanomicrobiales archaeon]|jgi:rfaE bifunctional protein kinase chain/domain/rfaE bifunctional protein nucleotidyltransferase chain/domain|nr:adenylyltransferase/cytidyltransferase family protein [Methanomicrobiales archaeon]
MGKIFPIHDLSELLNTKRDKKIILCHGVFDLLHIGHIKYFEEAKSQGDILVVTVTPDRFVNKGPDRPHFTEQLRLEAIAALEIVDYVALNLWPTAVETLLLLKPDIYAKGPDYQDQTTDLTGKIRDEEEAIRSVGGELFITSGQVFSSSRLLNQSLSGYTDEQIEYFRSFALKHPADEVISWLKRLHTLRVLVIGETIIDRYSYCYPIGMVTKDPIIAVKYLHEEWFAGGIIAVANHGAGFYHSVDLISALGEKDSYEQFIHTHLKDEVNSHFIYKTDSPTIIKQRFVDAYLNQKLFEVHTINDEMVSMDQTNELIQKFSSLISDIDLVLVVDFGHGMISSPFIEKIVGSGVFTAVNTQTNAGNRGFNVISRYPKVDYVSLNATELNLEERTNAGDIKSKILNVVERVSANEVLITEGKYGTILYDREDGFIRTPAFAGKVVDRIGAGDAIISITAGLACLNAPADIIGFVANAVASMAVSTVGHRTSIEPVGLYKYITTLLK